MAELKTKRTPESVMDFLNAIPDEKKREDSIAIMAMMRDISGSDPEMWGDSIIGFGSLHYRYKSGREGDWFVIGFSPRKQNLTLYLNYGFEQNEGLMSRLGKYKTGKACLYIKNLEDVDLGVLAELIQQSASQTA